MLNTAGSINKKSAKGRIKSSTVAIYASVFVLLVAVIAVGYKAPEEVSTVASVTPTVATPAANQPTVNDVVATDIAATVAYAADLAVAPNIAELAVSTKIQSEYSGLADNSTVSKPVILQLSSASRNITSYEVQPGDTVASVAAKFKITDQTLRWANNLTNNETLKAGSTVSILPVNGISYTVKDGDTLGDIAKRYEVNATTITTYNDLELNGISTGLQIVIPDGILPKTERPGYVETSFITGYSSGMHSSSTWFMRYGTPNYGSYAPRNCTAYAFDRRLELGMPIGTTWGNAGTWATQAKRDGYLVDRNPAVGAVIQDWGHVAIVEKILPNGDLELSEMNNATYGPTYPGNNVVNGRILPKAYIGQYYYIHGKL